DAARGMLIAALLSAAGTPVHPAVVTTSADISALLDTPDVPDGVPGLLVARDLTEAIAAVEDVAVARADGATNQTDAQQGSRTVLLAASPADPQTARRVRVLLKLTADKAVSGVLLGDWRPGDTWRVGPGGVVENAEPPARLGLLGAAATGDLL